VVSHTVSDPAVAVGDSTSHTIPAGQDHRNFGFRGLKAGAVSAIFTAPGYKPDTTVITVDTAQLGFGAVPATLGVNQTAQMYVQVPFTNESPIVVTLGTSPAGVISVPPTVTIPARAGYVYFAVNGVANGTAHVTATAQLAKPGTSTDIVVGQPKLQLSLQSSTPNVGQKYLLFVQPLDSLGTSRAVSTPLTITLVSSDPAHTTFDSATITIPTNGNIVQTGVTFTQAGSYTITGSATGYASDNVSATASGALVQMSGTNFVPQTVTINAGQYVTWRNLDPVSHTTTEDSGPIWNSGLIATGNTYQRLFGTAGTFTYHCTVHPGMTGTVIVQP
jgi:plastocyanin